MELQAKIAHLQFQLQQCEGELDDSKLYCQTREYDLTYKFDIAKNALQEDCERRLARQMRSFRKQMLSINEKIKAKDATIKNFWRRRREQRRRKARRTMGGVSCR